MKKIFALLMAVVMCLSFAACGKDKEEEVKTNQIDLTTENIGSYLSFSSKVEECEFYEGYGFTGGYFGAKGAANILVESVNKSGAEFKNVSITCQIWARGGLNCGWEFTSGNKRSEIEYNMSANYKEITFDLSSDGKWSTTASLEWENYKGEWNDSAAVYDELSDTDIEVKIIKVSGSVVVDE